ncbi:hypothetical protein DOTSEDRAFT_70731 [Dothistroma septosporum NZE10]|uniref:nicotinamidase n=1 Tax=Dothistroma septosporum (strain NZE10 / CBS 128990) TaxID=675120 RepID=N1PTT9_DOTSN|nr:hypothetical protein DOTSEDRAFT_70731 [Dothistroma septosporum NZE10]
MASNTNREKKTALLIIDMQEDFCFPNGSLAVKDGREVASVINDLLDYSGFALKVGTKDYHTEDHISFARHHPGAEPFTSQHTIKNPENESETQTTFLWPDHCVVGSKGVELIPEVQWKKVDSVVDKGVDPRVEAYSAFGPPFRKPMLSMSNLDELLKKAGVSDVFVVGLAYDFCVKATAIDAAEFGYKTFVVEQGTKAVFQSEAALTATRKDLEQAGVVVVGLDSAEVKAIKA